MMEKQRPFNHFKLSMHAHDDRETRVLKIFGGHGFISISFLTENEEDKDDSGGEMFGEEQAISFFETAIFAIKAQQKEKPRR